MQQSGSGQVNASALRTGDANVNLNGSGRMSLGQMQGGSLTAIVHGSGSLQASGAVDTVNAHVHGSGRITVYGNPAQRSVSGKHVLVLN